MEKKQYTLEEVAKNNGENGARVWIILRGNVYDVTDYVQLHPGGAELIGEYAGGDATKGFDEFGHSSDAKKIMKKYEIGVVAKGGSEKQSKASPVSKKSNKENNRNATNKKNETVDKPENGSAVKEYSLEEIAEHNGANGSRVWIILGANVYDVTDYMDQHPGGSELIAEYAGTDATQGFDEFGHSSDAKKIMKKYEIGVVAGKAGRLNAKLDKDNAKNMAQRKLRRRYLRLILGPCASK